MELQIKDIQLALAKLLNHYPESGHNSNTLGRLAFDWFDLLSEDGVTQKQFSAGIRHSVKTCRFFPKLADVLAGVTRYRENPPPPTVNATMITDTTGNETNWTPEEIERNKKRISHIVSMLSKEKSMDDAIIAVERCGHIDEFGGGKAYTNIQSKDNK